VREHLHVDTVHGSPAELAGERLHFAGGNDAIGLMRGWGPPAVAGPTPGPQIGSSVPSGPAQARGASIANTSGGVVSLGRVQVTTCALFLFAVGALIVLNRAGFKFSVTVG
jgi:hypothetical protein